jgi:hypothetical protein
MATILLAAKPAVIAREEGQEVIDRIVPLAPPLPGGTEEGRAK